MNTNNHPAEHCGFVGPSSIYAKFRINTSEYDCILVSHEGNWIGPLAFHPHYKRYEDVQADLGCGFKFKSKEYSHSSGRSLFYFERNPLSLEHFVVVPASGEDLNFEIYGLKDGETRVLWIGEV